MPGLDETTDLLRLLGDPTRLRLLALLAREELTVEMRRAFDGLSAQERRILASRYGLDDRPGRSLNEVGAELGLSRERIRQIEARAIERLRRALDRRARTVRRPSRSLGVANRPATSSRVA